MHHQQLQQTGAPHSPHQSPPQPYTSPQQQQQQQQESPNKHSKNWTFTNVTQQSIMHQNNVQHSPKQVRIVHRHLSNSDGEAAEDHHHHENNNPDQDKSFSIYHWKCNLKKNRSNSTPSTPTSSSLLQQQPKQPFAANNAQEQNVQQQQHPIVVQGDFVPRAEYEKLAAKVESMEQQITNMANNYQLLMQQFNEMALIVQQQQSTFNRSAADTSPLLPLADNNSMDMVFFGLDEEEERRRSVPEVSLSVMQHQQQQQPMISSLVPADQQQVPGVVVQNVYLTRQANPQHAMHIPINKQANGHVNPANHNQQHGSGIMQQLLQAQQAQHGYFMQQQQK